MGEGLLACDCLSDHCLKRLSFHGYRPIPDRIYLAFVIFLPNPVNPKWLDFVTLFKHINVFMNV